jgi:SAM-dependent methyltransferase
MSPMARWLATDIFDSVGLNSTVLEVGCGPGALAFMLGGKCANVFGIDVSRRMIEQANRTKRKKPMANVSFECMDASTLERLAPNHFDYAIAMFCLHEMDPNKRELSVRQCLHLATEMIIADYRAAFPKGIVGTANNALEAIAGRRHYQNFKDWQASGGIDGMVERMCLEIIESREWNDKTGKTVIVRSRPGSYPTRNE